MKLNMTTLIDFNVNKEEMTDNRTLLRNNPGYRDLINQKKLLNQLLILSHNVKKWKLYQTEYRKDIILAKLNFISLKFRRSYLKWIYTNYSNSLANQNMVQQNEALILFKWAKHFNQQYRHLKLIKILPRINNSHLYAYLLLIPFSINNKLSFSLKEALISEYHTDHYDQAIYKFENDAGNLLSDITQRVFHQCVPDGHFHLINHIDQTLSLKLKPINYKKNKKIQPVNRKEAHHQLKSKNVKLQTLNQGPLLSLTSNSISLLPSASSKIDSQSLSILVKSSKSRYLPTMSSDSSAFSLTTSSPDSTKSMAQLISINTSLTRHMKYHINKRTESQSKSSSSLEANNVLLSYTDNNSNLNNNKSRPSHIFTESYKNKGYITLITIISFIIVALLIIIFPLFKF